MRLDVPVAYWFFFDMALLLVVAATLWQLWLFRKRNGFYIGYLLLLLVSVPTFLFFDFRIIDNSWLLPLQEGGSRVSFAFVEGEHTHAGSFFYYFKSLLLGGSSYESKSVIGLNIFLGAHALLLLFFIAKLYCRSHVIILLFLFFFASSNYFLHAIFSAEAAPLLWNFIAMQFLLANYYRRYKHSSVYSRVFYGAFYGFVSLLFALLIASIRLEYLPLSLTLTFFVWLRLLKKAVHGVFQQPWVLPKTPRIFHLLFSIFIVIFFSSLITMVSQENSLFFIFHKIYENYLSLFSMLLFFIDSLPPVLLLLFLSTLFIGFSKTSLSALPKISKQHFGGGLFLIIFYLCLYSNVSHLHNFENFRYYTYQIIVVVIFSLIALPFLQRSFSAIGGSKYGKKYRNLKILFVVLLLAIVNYSWQYRNNTILKKMITLNFAGNETIFADQQVEAQLLYFASQKYSQCSIYSFLYSNSSAKQIVLLKDRTVKKIPADDVQNDLQYFEKILQNNSTEHCYLFLYGIDCNQVKLSECRPFLKYPKVEDYSEYISQNFPRYNDSPNHFYPFQEKAQISLHKIE